MTRFLTFIVVLLFPVLLIGQNNFDSLLHELDTTVDNYQLYSNKKEAKITNLKDLLKFTSTDLQQYEIGQKLFD